MTHKDFIAQIPDGELKKNLQELIIANDSLQNKKPTLGFHYRFYVPGWIGFIQECLVESKMNKFNKEEFYAGKGYIDFINWLAEKADNIAKSYSETENMSKEESDLCKELTVSIFNSTIGSWVKCCPEIASYSNIEYGNNKKISPINWINYRLASTLKDFDQSTFDFPTSHRSRQKQNFASNVKALGWSLIGYILNVILLLCIIGLLSAIFK